ncbi:MAG TPA: RNA polymerase factor sigma-32 [Kiloniellales bacterium]
MRDELAPFLEMADRYPMLSAEEEKQLALAWQKRGDEKALDKLVGSHLRLVIRIARDNSGYGLPIGDLIGEGNVGLLHAADRFDPERGVRFATYAAWWIRAMIREYALYSRSLVKMGTTAAQKKLFFNLSRLKTEFKIYDNGELKPSVVRRISERLGVPEVDVIQMNNRLATSDWSLNASVNDEEWGEFQDLLVDESPDPEDRVVEADQMAKRHALLGEAMAGLSAREQHILRERKLSDDPQTLEQLSEQYGISRERVRQIEARAIERLREKMLAAVEEAKADARDRQLVYAG